MNKQLLLDQVTVKYDNQSAVANASFELAEGEIGEETPVTLNRVICEIRNHAGAQYGHDDLPGAMLEFLIDAHERMESQRGVVGQ